MLFIGEEFYCFGACDEKRALLFDEKEGNHKTAVTEHHAVLNKEIARISC
jgi:hypothetical protein